MNRKVKSAGTTLVEMMVALSLLVMAGTIILELFSANFFGITQAGQLFLASQLGREKLEGYLRRGYDWIQTQPHTVAGTTTITTMAEGKSRSATFEYSISHKPVIADGVDEVNVQVFWKRRGKPQVPGCFLSSWINR